MYVLPALGARTSYLNWRSEPHEISAEFVFCCPGLQHNGPLVSWKTSYLSVGGPPTPLKTLGAIHNYNIIVHVWVYTHSHMKQLRYVHERVNRHLILYGSDKKTSLCNSFLQNKYSLNFITTRKLSLMLPRWLINSLKYKDIFKKPTLYFE